MKKAFSLLELVVVMVILGIVATIGTNIITTMYKDYLRSKAINRLESQTSITLEQIAKRLSYRVKGSLGVVRASGIIDIKTADETDKDIIWLGVSHESFTHWNGFIDLDNINTSHTQKTLYTPGSKLRNAEPIIAALTDNKVSIKSSTKEHPAVIFKNSESKDIKKYYTHEKGDYTLKVSAKDDQTFKIVNDEVSNYGGGKKKIYEQYQLSHTAYAITCDGDDAKDFNLTLHYNFRPWENQSYKDGYKATLCEHVSTFRILKKGNILRIKLCIKDDKTGLEFSACKETVVF